MIFQRLLSHLVGLTSHYAELFLFGEPSENHTRLHIFLKHTPLFVSVQLQGLLTFLRLWREQGSRAALKKIKAYWKNEEFFIKVSIIAFSSLLLFYFVGLLSAMPVVPALLVYITVIANITAGLAFLDVVGSLTILYPLQVLVTLDEMSFPFPPVRLAASLWARFIVLRGRTNEILENGDTWLHWAAVNGYKEATRLFIVAGSNLEAKNHRGDTPLLGAVRGPYSMRVLPLLIASGADLQATSSDDYRPNLRTLPSTPIFHVAVNYGNPQTVRYLAQQNIDVNAVNPSDKYLNTALHIAVEDRYPNLNMVHCLINTNKVDLNKRNKLGHTPLEIALANDDPMIVKLLIDNGATFPSSYQRIIQVMRERKTPLSENHRFIKLLNARRSASTGDVSQQQAPALPGSVSTPSYLPSGGPPSSNEEHNSASSSSSMHNPPVKLTM